MSATAAPTPIPARDDLTAAAPTASGPRVLLVDRPGPQSNILAGRLAPAFDAASEPQTQLMKTDIREKDGQYLLEIEVPGFTKEDVKAELKDGYLTITADRKEPVENADERTKYVRKERYYGTMKRTFYLGEEITENEIHAAFRDGILRIMIDKPQPKKIEEEKTIIPIEG